MNRSRLSRARALRATVGVGVVAALVGSGLVAGQALAAGKPQRVLQAVNVDLGSDGTLYAIKGINVRKADGEKASSDKVTYDPTKTADELPVRVLTSYHAGSRSGTNLADLKGYDGPLEIDVTVQNTTVKPQKLTYDSGGRTRTAYGLVGVPLTVVASSTLGDDAVDQVVTSSDSGGATTNGVLSRDQKGKAVVQWASILAPPQLAPSTTFSLVMNAEDFSLPSLDLSVQPGLAADTSIASLLSSAFGTDSDSALELQTRTIKLITEVTGVLAAAGEQLVDVRKQLNFSAGKLGDQTIEDLSSSTDTVATSTQQLTASLSDLGTDLGTTLRASKRSADAALQRSVASITTTLGDPDAAVPTPVLTGAGCASSVKKMGRAGTVIGQLNQVSSLLDGLSGATGACRDAVVGSLNRTIGTLDPDGQPVCPAATTPGPTSALCAIADAHTKTGTAISALDSALATAKQSILANTSVTAAQDKVSALEQEVVNLQELARNPLGTSGGTKSLSQELDDLKAHVQDIRDEGLSGRLTSSLDALHASALDQLARIGASSDTDGESSYAELSQLQAKLDSLQLDPADPGSEDTRDDISELVHDLRGHADDEVTAWQDVRDASAPGSTTYGAAQGLDSELAGLQDQIDTIKSGSLLGYAAVLKGLDDLYVAPTFVKQDPDSGRETATALTCTNKDDPSYVTYADRDNPVLQTELAVLDVQCLRQHDADQVGAGVDAQTQVVRDAQAGLEASEGTLDQRRAMSAKEIQGLFKNASGGLAVAGSRVHADGRTTVRGVRSKLATSQEAAEQELDGYVVSALKSINDGVSGSTRDLDSAADLLSKDLRSVLADLGSRDKSGTGLLGIVQAQAATTRTSTAKVADATAQAASFGNVRSEDLDGIFLQSAQLQAALARQSDLAPFALSLPNGSQHRSVYSFHMRAVK